MPEASTQTGLDDHMRWATAHPGDASGWEILFNPDESGIEVEGEGSQEAVPTSRPLVVKCGDIDPITETTCELTDSSHQIHKFTDTDRAFEFRWKYHKPFQADGVLLDPEDLMLEVPEAPTPPGYYVVPGMY